MRGTAIQDVLSEQEVLSIRAPGRHAIGGVVGLAVCVRDDGSRRYIVEVVKDKKKHTRGCGGNSTPIDEVRQRAAEFRSEVLGEPCAGIVGRVNITKKNQDEALAMYEGGTPQKRIAASFGIKQNTVSTWIRNAKARRAPGAIKVNAPWATVFRQNGEAAGHALAARIHELAEPGITREIREAVWRAFEEILEADRAAA